MLTQLIKEFIPLYPRQYLIKSIGNQTKIFCFKLCRQSTLIHPIRSVRHRVGKIVFKRHYSRGMPPLKPLPTRNLDWGNGWKNELKLEFDLPF